MKQLELSLVKDQSAQFSSIFQTSKHIITCLKTSKDKPKAPKGLQVEHLASNLNR